jgi:hypothetical protein
MSMKVHCIYLKEFVINKKVNIGLIVSDFSTYTEDEVVTEKQHDRKQKI